MSGLCFDAIYYLPLPGKVNYCLGVKHWKAGDYPDAMELMRLAAGWGNKNAQYTLGLIYYNGRHVPADRALGVAWLKLANERHDDAVIAQATRSAIHWATPGQRARADQLFNQMRRTYGDKVAAARAWHHLQHWNLTHGGPFAAGCQKLYGAQLYYVRSLGVMMRGACLPMQQKRQIVQYATSVYFQGWMGTVTVGPLKQVPAAAASSDH